MSLLAQALNLQMMKHCAAPILQLHRRVIDSNIQGRSPNVVKVISHIIRKFHIGKNSLPLGANSSLKEKFLF